MADDSMYTKIVSRRMIEMTRTINTTWKPHVAETGVTCYTCHRGQPVPANIWFSQKDHIAAGSAADNKGHNTPAPNASYSSLPRDAFTPLFASAGQIRVIGKDALSTDAPGESIATTERTYSLMMHMSTGLGVNCTFCHNTRAFAEWDQSPPQRVTAWHGIRMVQGLNATYLEPLKSTYPATRLGPEGDAPKANCATCHQGVSKPLGGVSMLKDYIKELSAPPR
jgi:photosynthetic reaction center cytochrome c subunit